MDFAFLCFSTTVLVCTKQNYIITFVFEVPSPVTIGGATISITPSMHFRYANIPMHLLNSSSFIFNKHLVSITAAMPEVGLCNIFIAPSFCIPLLVGNSYQFGLNVRLPVVTLNSSMHSKLFSMMAISNIFSGLRKEHLNF